MSAYKEFKKSPYKDKVKLIKKYGTHIATRNNGPCDIRLFAIRDFFVEVWSTHLLPWKNIVRIKSFRDSNTLDPYLDKVDVKKVLSA
jgi:hypothetical protein